MEFGVALKARISIVAIKETKRSVESNGGWHGEEDLICCHKRQ